MHDSGSEPDSNRDRYRNGFPGCDAYRYRLCYSGHAGS
jgi:hypothetical protein